MRRILAVIATSCAITAAVAAPSSASTTADPPAYNNRTLFLSNRPTDDMATACWERQIVLKTAHYGWYNSFDHKVKSSRGIDIQGNTYTWKTCLDPKNGYYLIKSELTGPGYAYMEGQTTPPFLWSNIDVGSKLVIE